ncbi:hypothetical protein [Helicobacter sp. 13S00477-4]|uniref:hypothetical protein n=1 Tax=Helicobacter sp. 13S00477-4 TaxID=1905759 RepID=UPI000BA75F21|nr:hypothetical protein [Helicobacter sp. 13S00477-4]PAF51499.1 hypothetical protein BKH44_05495 [Helicobacter sp. 13S00477-4]
MTQEFIEIKISGRKFQIRLNGFTQEAIDEIKQTFEDQNLELVELLQSHLNKIQEYSLLNQHLKGILQKISQ